VAKAAKVVPYGGGEPASPPLPPLSRRARKKRSCSFSDSSAPNTIIEEMYMNKEIILTELDQAILGETNTVLGNLSEGEVHTMKELLSEDFLKHFPGGLANEVGRRLSFLVSCKLLSLEVAGRNAANHKLYIVKRSEK